MQAGTSDNSGDDESPLPSEVRHARLTDPARLARLRASGLLDGAIVPVLDRLTRIASVLLDVPVSAVSLVDDLGQHFPGMTGLDGAADERRSTPLSQSFCQHVVTRDAALIVENASEHPLVAHSLPAEAMGVVAYAGVPLRNADGFTLGAFCAVDVVPKKWSPEQLQLLEDIAKAAMAEIDLRTTVRALLDNQAQLRHDATRDLLTGVLNRRGLSELAPPQLALAQRTAQPFSVLAVDLDGFKQINDTLGHDTGDAALVEMAQLLAAEVREGDCVVRMGGDEFLILLADSDHSQALAFVSRLQQRLRARNAETDSAYQLSAAMGVGSWTPATPLCFSAVLEAADVSMYADKRTRSATAGG
jgi:diguanylate cyclase (GGDEF)-like protein